MPSSAASRFFSYHKLAKDDTYPLTPHHHTPAPFYDPTTTLPTTPTARRPLPFGTRWARLYRSGSSGGGFGGAGSWRPRRPRVRVAGLRRLLGRKARLLREAVRKVVQRFREGKAHFGDLFAGNYMFLQVNPTSAASASKASAYIQAQQYRSSSSKASAYIQAQQYRSSSSAAATAAVGLRGRHHLPPVAAAPRYYLPYRVAA